MQPGSRMIVLFDSAEVAVWMAGKGGYKCLFLAHQPDTRLNFSEFSAWCPNIIRSWFLMAALRRFSWCCPNLLMLVFWVFLITLYRQQLIWQSVHIYPFRVTLMLLGSFYVLNRTSCWQVTIYAMKDILCWPHADADGIFPFLVYPIRMSHQPLTFQLTGQIHLPIKVTPSHVLEKMFCVLLPAVNVSYFIFSLCIFPQLRSCNYLFAISREFLFCLF